MDSSPRPPSGSPRHRIGTRSLLASMALALLIVGAFASAPALEAQVTRADTAAVLLDAARTFESEGRADLAEGLLSLLVERFSDTGSGQEAYAELATLRSEHEAGRGHAGYVVWSTIFGAWMGIAVPAAFGANDPEPFGIGLLLGTPAGFFGSRAYGSAVGMTVGASRAITFSWMWTSWQAMGWTAALDIGSSDGCREFGCVPEQDDQSVWIASVAGGLAGYTAGILATRAFDVNTGMAEMLWHSSIWGTGYGYALGYLADLGGDDLLMSALVGGNIGLVAGIPAAHAWRPTSGHVRLVSVAGLAGAAAGLGVDLLVTPESEKTAVAIPTIGATLGLIAGAIITANDEPEPESLDDMRGFDRALLQFEDGVRFGLPAPIPERRARVLPDGTTEWGVGARITLLNYVF